LPNLTPEQEKLLLKQMAEGNEKAFETIFHAYRDKLFAFIFRLSASKEVSEDIVQDVFLKVWKKRETLSGVENFNAFLFRIAHNHAINQLKRLSKETLVRSKAKINPSGSTAPDKQLTFKNLQRALEEIVAHLPPRQKEIYRLKRERHLKQDEIARQLHISPSTVKNHLTQALRTIREKLRHYYPDMLLVGFVLILAVTF